MSFEAGSEVAVSDHALLRWLERVHGYDIAILRRRICAFMRTQRIKDSVVVRFVEDGLGIDLGPMRQKMRDHVASAHVAHDGRQMLALKDGIGIVLQRDDGTWTMATVLDPGMEHRLKGK